MYPPPWVETDQLGWELAGPTGSTFGRARVPRSRALGHIIKFLFGWHVYHCCDCRAGPTIVQRNGEAS
jgi:hypothetical protein